MLCFRDAYLGERAVFIAKNLDFKYFAIGLNLE